MLIIIIIIIIILQVYIGWITPHFRMSMSSFDMKKIRNVVVCTLDQDNAIKSRSVRLD